MVQALFFGIILLHEVRIPVLVAMNADASQAYSPIPAFANSTGSNQNRGRAHRGGLSDVGVHWGSGGCRCVAPDVQMRILEREV